MGLVEILLARPDPMSSAAPNAPPDALELDDKVRRGLRVKRGQSILARAFIVHAQRSERFGCAFRDWLAA